MSSWQPTATLQRLQLRAQILQKIRAFFAVREVLEVETPLLSHTSVTDPFIESIPVLLKNSAQTSLFYLQTSPEYAMKRLLAAGSGPIYQICKAFRQDEVGRLHQPEFTMLEWYRPGFDHHQLMAEMADLLREVFNMAHVEKITYAELFEKKLKINPHKTSLSELAACAKMQNISCQEEIKEVDTWLQLLMSHCLEPHLGQETPCFVYDFPVTQAALAKIQQSDPPVASRFEVYFKGMELANGFHELQDAKEQRKRFEKNVAERKCLGLTEMKIDENFLAALEQGLPDCAGVALGVDRLLMLATQSAHIADVISFDIERA